MGDDNCPSSGVSAQTSTRFGPPVDHTLHVQTSNKQHSSQASTSNSTTIVYIPDLPSSIPEDELEEMIMKRLNNTKHITVNEVICYPKLGIGIIRVENAEEQKHLVENVESVVLDKLRHLNVSFTNKLELDSYIVFDQKASKIPSSQDIAHHFEKTYKTETLRVCERISVQFPNIFHIIPATLDDLVKTVSVPDFRIEDSFAVVYPHAECSFFEDLPSHMDGDKLSSIIVTQIGDRMLSPTSFYVQHDKQTSTGVVLAVKSISKWTMADHFTIDGQPMEKKKRLICRVLVYPVTRDADISRILNHTMFTGRVISHEHINEHLVIKLDNMTTYENCLDIGALRIDDKTMTIKQYTAVSGSNSNELDANNWYERAMLDIKPDIMTIIHDPQHPVFRYQWNAVEWLEQMRKIETKDRRSKNNDHTRHLLRVTVMLNTIGVIRKKKYVVDGEEVLLKSERLRTIGYDHKAKLSCGKTIAETELKTPFPLTTVNVINEDCLVLYEKLVSEGHQPVLLNMANAKTPGGGYRKGDGAQEENIFRRSDYYQSLDIQVADSDRSERFSCTSKCELKRLAGHTSFYPMAEYGAIYTSGMTVFRQTEEQGYALMKKPLYDVCAIAVAAYRDPPLTDKNMLDDRAAMNTLKKMETIFKIAHHHKHDCLVLSAFGCGAFKNPPEHIALLFKSIIYQYAGYFQDIYFAIVDDHNTGNNINPRGNFLPFEEILNKLIVHPSKSLRLNGISGPHRIVDKSSDGKLILSEICILHAPPCQHGSKCHDLNNAQHTNSFSHPPMCSPEDLNSSCTQMKDEVHMFTFLHKSKCKHGAECSITDSKHSIEYEHPEYCQDQSGCVDTTPEHLSAYRHLPLCQDGTKCIEYLRRTPDHCNFFRHCKLVCSYDNCCVRFHDQEHMKHSIHSFRTPCPFTPYNCSMFVKYIQRAEGQSISEEIEKHCLEHSHICPFGRQCTTKDEAHYLTFIHLARQLCPDGDKCTKITQEYHLEVFSHPAMRDIRLFCREPGFKCPDRLKKEHFKKYRHGQNHDHLSVVPSSNFNANVNFSRNQGQMIRNVNTYVEASGWKKANISSDILSWIRASQPVHRCNKLIFESILVHGHVMSRHYMELLKKPKFVVKAVLQHSRIRRIVLEHNTHEVKENVHELIKLLVQAEFAKTGADGVPPVDPEHDYNVQKFERRLKPPLKDLDVQAIHKWAVKIARASIELHSHPMGIGFDVDQKLGTDKHIFSILGPHHGHYYGDIVITFKQEIMFHPDANFSVQAGTTFPSARIYAQRPWMKDPGSEVKHIEDFHRAKLHCSVPRYEYAAGAELVAVSGISKKSMNVDLDTVIQQWISTDSHFVFESHLPQLIPLDYIDNVYMPNNLFQSLSAEAQHSARAVFRKSLILSDHPIDLSLAKPGSILPLDDTRKPYLKYILESNMEKIKERIVAPQISRGIVITVPGTKFEDQIVLPMTISQSYSLYRLDNLHTPDHPEITYIYWQAMNGDMMLTISNDKIEPAGKDQPNLRCLICYVAEKPSTTIENYHEAYSYLNIGHPYQHYNNIHTSDFKAKSNVFYRGCNTDDFFTFRLKLNHKTGEVTLSHVGPNSIYNHEKITYRFSKTELDLSRIDYVYVSAGHQDVPIRNLTINHTPVVELEHLFDKDFKIDTSALLRKRAVSNDQIPRVQYAGDGHNRKAASRSREKQSSSTQPARRASPSKKLSFFKKIRYALFGSPRKDNPPASRQPQQESPARHRSRSESSGSDRARAKKPKASSPQRASSKLPPCNDSVYCLNQNVKDHAEKYSHPCRFNEVCRNQVDEPHLTHVINNVSQCSEDRNCSRKTDPVHRAKYRHTNLPDYLFPCRYQEACSDKSSDHRIRFFHGETLPSIKKNKSLSGYAEAVAKPNLYPCRYGEKCRMMKDPQHRSKYSHPTS